MSMTSGSGGLPSSGGKRRTNPPGKTEVIKPQLIDKPAEGSYEGIARYLFDGLLSNSLPDYVYNDLACATEELISPIRQYVSNNQDYIRTSLIQLVDSEYPSKAIFAIRLLPFCGIEDGLYNKLRDVFLNIQIPNEDYWQCQKKKYLSATLPYFKQYNSDDQIKHETLNYW